MERKSVVVVKLAMEHGPEVVNLGERKNLGNRRTELLLTDVRQHPR